MKICDIFIVSLDCYANYEGNELVGVCIGNMLPEFRDHLKNLDISRFAQLLQKARKTTLSVKKMHVLERRKGSKDETISRFAQHVEKTGEKRNLPKVLAVSTGNR